MFRGVLEFSEVVKQLFINMLLTIHDKFSILYVRCVIPYEKGHIIYIDCKSTLYAI